MSIARFSSDDFRSDVYVYVDATTELIALHIATGRHDVNFDELPPPVPYDENIANVFGAEWLERHQIVMEKIRASEFIEYTDEYAGKSYHDLTVEEAVELLRVLEERGYHIPDGTIEAVAEEFDTEIAS